MSDYTCFDTSVQCEEANGVSEEEYYAVWALMADEAEAEEGYGAWAEETERAAMIEQARFDAEQEKAKDYLGGYRSPVGPRLGGFDI